MNQLKRWTASLMAAMLLSSCLGVAVFAEEMRTYTIEEAGISIEIPSELVVITQETPESDPVWNAFGIKKSEMQQLNRYFYAINETDGYDIAVIVDQAAQKDYVYCTDTELEQLAKQREDRSLEAGFSHVFTSVYRQGQTNFLRTYRLIEGETFQAFIVKYETIHKGNKIQIEILSYHETFKISHELMMKQLIDRVTLLGSDAQPLESKRKTPAFSVQDEQAQVSFRAPAGWTKVSNDRSMEDGYWVTLLSNEGAAAIEYRSVNDWKTASREELDYYKTREKYIASIDAQEELMALTGQSVDEIETVTSKDVVYSRGMVTKDSPAYQGVDQTVLVWTGGEWVQSFVITGATQAQLEEVDRLLSTVVDAKVGSEPEPEPAPQPVPEPEPAPQLDKFGMTVFEEPTIEPEMWADLFVPVIILWNLILIKNVMLLLFAELPMLLYRYAIRKSPIAPRRAAIGAGGYCAVSILVALCFIQTYELKIVASGVLLACGVFNFFLLKGSGRKPRAVIAAIRGTIPTYAVPATPAAEAIPTYAVPATPAAEAIPTYAVPATPAAEAIPIYAVPAAPATGAPATGAPAMGAPAMGASAMGDPATGAPTMGAPAMGAPAMGAPAMGAPAMGASAMGDPATGAPATGAPAPTKSVFCYQCGNRLTPPDALFCGQCGVAVRK